MGWFPTPNRSPDLSPSGWADGGTLLNGGGFQLNSFGSHKEYIFEWPQSSQMRYAQLMKSYADGSFGRGLIYFLDPLIYTKNVLPAMWADPSMGVGYEGSSLVYGVDPTALPTSNWETNELPIKSAYYDLGSIATGWRGKEDAVFIPVPEGYTFSFGSIHSQTGQGRVYYRTQSKAGALGTVTEVTPLPTNTAALVNTFVSGVDLAGVWLFIGKAAAGAGSVTLSAMTGRLLPSVKAVVAPVATNLFTNPRLAGNGTYAEVGRNLFTNPRLVGDGTWAEVRRNLITNPSFEVNTAGWATSDSTATVDTSTFYSGESSAKVVTSLFQGRIVLDFTNVVASNTYTLSAWVKGESGKKIQAQILEYDSSNTLVGTASETPEITVSGEWQRITLSRTFGASGVKTRATIRNRTAGAHTFYVDAVQLEVGSVATPYFDGSSPQGSVDPDMRQRWLGAENASESVMEIERVRGLTATNCVAGVSTKGGKPAVRQTPTSASTNDSFIALSGVFASNPSLAGLGTLVGSVNLDAPLTGSLRGSRLSLYVAPPVHQEQAQNTAGAHNLRNVFSGLTGSPFARLSHGGSLGSGDVWWTDIGLFAGSYDGPAFNGSSGPISIGPQLATTEWDGATDNSTSTAYSTSTELINVRKGPWIGGQGHSGCRFIGKPTYSPLSPINGGQVGFSASFKEVGSWVNG